MRYAITSPDLRTLVRLQVRVVAALILRETRATFGTSHIGYLWAIITPVVSIAILASVFSLAGRHPPFGTSLALFFATGIIVLQLVVRLGSGLMTAIEANRALLSYPPIKRLDVLLARAILIVLTFLVIGLIIHTALIAMGLADLPVHPERILGAYAAACLLGLGIGMINALLLTLWDSWRRIEPILAKPLFFVSGIFYVPDYLPPQVLTWLKWNPVLHAVEWMRNGYYADYDSMVLDKAYLVVVGAILVFVGLAGERLTRRNDAP